MCWAKWLHVFYDLGRRNKFESFLSSVYILKNIITKNRKSRYKNKLVGEKNGMRKKYESPEKD